MSKLTKPQAAAHAKAESILSQDTLSDDDRFYVLEHWQESATNMNSAAGAFFTPYRLAADMALEVSYLRGTVRVLDLCAGAGTLGFAVRRRNAWQIQDGSLDLQIVCVETNADYVRVGRKILPEAQWIHASIFDLPDLGGRFDYAIANPPFGNVARDGRAPRYTGAEFEYHVLDIAAHHADAGVFILPQQSTPFRFSGQDRYWETTTRKHDRFVAQTGIQLAPGCGVDTTVHRDDWHGVSVVAEVATCNFDRPVASVLGSPPVGAAFDDVPLFDLDAMAGTAPS